MVVSTANRRANHWIGKFDSRYNDYRPTKYEPRTNSEITGSCKIGPDDGRSWGTAVVDTNTKVWGTDNLFVVDGSIFPGMVTANPSAYIVVVAEHAAEKILALPMAQEQPRYAQCGGINWNGSYQCAAPYTCQKSNDYYSQVSASDSFPFPPQPSSPPQVFSPRMINKRSGRASANVNECA